jgi:hypothetical protein
MGRFHLREMVWDGRRVVGKGGESDWQGVGSGEMHAC